MRWGLIVGVAVGSLLLLLLYRTAEPGPISSPGLLPSFWAVPVPCDNEKETSSRLRCLKPYFEELATNGSVTSALARAKEFQRLGFIDHCHLPAHFIGRAGLAKNQGDAALAMVNCTPDCLNGCYHGVMEGYVSGRNSSDLVSEILSFCNHLPSSRGAQRDLRVDCLHGSGHGLMIVLRDRSSPLAEAVGGCRRLNAFWATDACLAGVFMENVNQYMLLDEVVVEQLIPVLCDPVISLNISHLRRACVVGIAETLLATGYNLTRTTELCRRLGAPEDRTYCIQSAKAADAVSRKASLLSG